MSYGAERWARQQKTGNARAKQVLIELANCQNDETGLCCPSRDYLHEVTELKHETISIATNHLEKIGLIRKVRESCEKGIRIRYELLGYVNPKTGSAQKRVNPENGLSPNLEEGKPEIGSRGKPEIGSRGKPEIGLVTRNSNKEIEQGIGTGNIDGTKKPNSDKRGTSFSLESIPEDWIGVANEINPDIDPIKFFDDFADYWRGVPGEKGRKKDWLATWRNALRNIPEWKRKNFLKARTVVNNEDLWAQEGYYEEGGLL